MHLPTFDSEKAVTAFEHASITNLFIFVAYDDAYYKLVAVTLAAAQDSPAPATSVNKYIASPPGNITLNASTASAMWDGTLAGFITTPLPENGYALKNVRAESCSSLCSPNT